MPITATPKIAANTTSTFVNFTLDPDFRVTVQENWAFMSLNTCGRTSRGGRWVWQHHHGNTETLFRVQLFCCPQSVYVTRDADGSGVISSQELPAAFREAGMCICVRVKSVDKVLICQSTTVLFVCVCRFPSE